MPFGWDPTTPKLHDPNYRKEPYVLYFLHIDITKKLMKVYRYLEYDQINKVWKKIDRNRIGQIVTNLTLDARLPNSSSIYYQYELKGEGNWHKLQFDHISYVAILIDSDNIILASPEHQTMMGGKVPIEFNSRDNGESNESFLDLVTFSVTPGASDIERPCILMVNHLKEDSQGTEIPRGEVHRFSFDILYFYKVGATSELRGLGLIDPGGDNIGPGEYPP